MRNTKIKLMTALSCLCIVFSVSSCYNDDGIQKRLSELERGEYDVKIANIHEQVRNINTSLTELKSTDTQIQEYIVILQNKATSLEQNNAELKAKIDKVNEDLQIEFEGEISRVKTELIDQLNAYKHEVEGQISAINTTIATLQDRDKQLQGEIKSLEVYVNQQLIAAGESNKEWANATFSTIEQHNALVETITGIDAYAKTLNTTIEALAKTLEANKSDLEAKLEANKSEIEGDLDDKLNNKYAELSQEIKDQIKDVTGAYTQAIEDAKSEITTAYETKIDNKIQELSVSMKAWVNNQLSAYYTIADADAKVEAEKKALEHKLQLMKTELELRIEDLEKTTETSGAIIHINEEIESLKLQIANINTEVKSLKATTIELGKELEEAKRDIKVEYTAFISSSINSFKGEVDKSISKQISKVNSKVDAEVEAIEADIEKLNGRVSMIEGEVALIKKFMVQNAQAIRDLKEQILKKIQSAVYVPRYKDGKATMNYRRDDAGKVLPGKAVLDYEISPKKLAGEIATLGKEGLKVEAVYTITRGAITKVSLDVVSVSENDGILTVEISGENLKKEYYDGEVFASVSLKIENDQNHFATDYIDMVPFRCE